MTAAAANLVAAVKQWDAEACETDLPPRRGPVVRRSPKGRQNTLDVYSPKLFCVSGTLGWEACTPGDEVTGDVLQGDVRRPQRPRVPPKR